MDKLRFYIAILVAKSVYTFLKLTKISSGTAFIGLLTLKICPKFLLYANKYITKGKINVTGTNGKTTTSGLLTHLIKNAGFKVVNNSLGANMLTGIVNTLATELGILNKADYSVIETDEAYLTKVYDNFDADYLLVTNLFNDQLDRYGSLDTTKKYIQNAIDKKTNLTLFLNADDPLVANFEGNNKIFYGIENVIYKDIPVNENCSNEEFAECSCGKKLNYTKKFYAKLGHYSCECGYKRPEPKYNGTIELHKDHSEIIINGTQYVVPLVGLFNAYNAFGAISMALELNIPDIEKNLTSFKVAFGRSEIKYLNGNKVLIQLIKNPTGVNEVLKTIDLNSSIMIMINDNYADGRDISWLWDANFEILQNAKKEIVVSGIRAEDMAKRLKDANCNKIKIIPELEKAVNYIGNNTDGDITILPSYTVLLKIDKMKCFKKYK